MIEPGRVNLRGFFAERYRGITHELALSALLADDSN
jgi:hypothetical protein